ncbi:hypothetical protein SEA_PAOLA_14 [Mycobacterium phage Paola]|uniref:Head-to-tail connector protein n=3 Tax=Kratiovirus TaxID=2948788 RepID=A0A345M942_9CAUD|nr:neck protein [Mycobacterium phage Gengar]YP_009950820.1 neck protein [Mycobacterium phage Paola]YP_009951003.1 neck protein [Mycobacterium phage Thyatira]AOQ28878.1 hypothetical protein SEA_WATERFOUL_14 [Mycobacterium phage Waterfoul]ASR85803.1 hypothetical protein SEA_GUILLSMINGER_14 [Mycobacterium phage Guillsminger]AON96669.1 hypothetical protein SEA_GENGAR_14 [Mycobacterium phage Gengar]AVO25805.1 hypothetical protein SEA_PAOLA_14 [Mycobacterium phage Paola]AXH67013.1 hypothetical pro
MGRLEFPFSEHAAIRRSEGVQRVLKQAADDAAREAGGIAGEPGGYDTDVTVGTDRARAHVWPATPKAYRAEAKTAPLMQVAAQHGPQT